MKCALSLFALIASIFAARYSRAAEPAIKRLDGSTITPAQIDESVTRLMRAAEVTGAGIAIFNPHSVQFLKAYGFREKERNLP